MADGKKIVFEGQDNGVFTMMDRLKRKADEMYQGILSDAQLVEQTEEKRTKFISVRIREIEQENKLLAQQKKLQLDLEYKQAMSEPVKTGADYKRQQLVQKQYEEDTEKLKGEQLRDNTIAGFLKESKNERTNELLRELIEAVERENEEKNFQAERADTEDDAQQRTFLDRLLGRNKPSILNPDNENLENKKSNKKQEAEKPMGFWDMVGALGTVELAKYAINKTQGVVSGASQAQSGETFAADLISTLPFGGIIGQPMRRHIDEQYKVQVAQNKLRGVIGDRMSVSDPSLGFSQAETLPITEDIARSTGKSDVTKLESQTKDLMVLERALSLDRSTTMQMFKDSRSTTDSTVTEDAARIMYETGTNEDTAKAQEFLQLQSQIIQQNKTIIDKQDKGVVANMIGRFTEVGGNLFSNPEVVSTIIQSFDQKLKSPSNDFEQARNFNVLSQIKPGASYFEMLEMESKGLQQENFLHETLKFAQKSTGGGENMMTMLTKNFGLTPAASRAFTEKFQQDPEAFKGMGGTEEQIASQANIDLGVKELTKQAKYNTSNREVERATIDDAFLRSEAEGMIKVAELTGQNLSKIFEEGMNKIIDPLLKKIGITNGVETVDKIFSKPTVKTMTHDEFIQSIVKGLHNYGIMTK